MPAPRRHASATTETAVHYDDPARPRQYSALVIDANGVQRVTQVTAHSSSQARQRLLDLGYRKVFWVL